ncbi:hypothetical protein M0804_000019 [Polistes exclamans]|nr:hypothetical protein M0804_000019 [Polistes exclamans]
MNETTRYIKTTFEKFEVNNYELFLRCIKGTKHITTPLFITPSCQYSSEIKYSRHNLRIDYNFDTRLYIGFLQVLYSIPFRSARKAVINEENKIITYDMTNGFKRKFKLSLNVTYISPVTENMLSFKTKHIQSMIQHINTLCMNSEFNDVAFRLDNSVFPVHRIILSAQSSVFENMFNYEQTNPQERKIITLRNDNLPYYRYKTFTIMLRYIYTNKIEDLDNVASEVIFLGDMFQITNLVEVCKDALIKHINKVNVEGILSIAEDLNLLDLKAQCNDYKERESSSSRDE